MIRSGEATGVGAHCNGSWLLALWKKLGWLVTEGRAGQKSGRPFNGQFGYGRYQLKIYDQGLFNALVFVGPPSGKVIHLWLHKGHFDVITSMPAFYENNFYCEICDKAYSRPVDHQVCPFRCPRCFHRGRCDMQQTPPKCDRCGRFFNSVQCYENHLQDKIDGRSMGRSICEQLKRCGDCDKEYYTRKHHSCGVRTCPRCKIDVDMTDHECFIKKFTPRSDRCTSVDTVPAEEDGRPASKKKLVEKQTTFIFYDLECGQDEVVGENDQGDINRHYPNLVVVHKVCDLCCSKDTLGACSNCVDNHRRFLGEQCLDAFCEWLFSKANNGSIAIAHNSKGYDAQFVLEYCHRQGLKPRNIITRGLGIVYMDVGGVTFKDSLNFLPMPLASLPKAFDIQEIKKGYFPHMYNRRANWHYVGEWPPAEDYQPQYMKGDDRKRFFDWYNKQQGKVFNFQEELVAYCESDVTVLRKCCLKFRQLFMTICGLDPLLESITIASACNMYYRMQHMPKDTIAVIPHGGYRKEERQSVIALKWLKWLAHSTGLRIRHKLNGGEVKIGNWKVDGFCEEEKGDAYPRGTVYEMNGCYWHGCPCCMKRGDQLVADGRLTAREAFYRTVARRRDIEAMGYRVIQQWECELRLELKRDPIMNTFFKGVEIAEPLDAREAFYGGRTNAAVLYKKAEQDEKIKYIDVLSLYPFICKYGLFPVGHPEVVTENFLPMTAESMPYEGLVKCAVLPPANLLHPVLPYRSNGKLTFPLCAKCVDTRQLTMCNHSDKERTLAGSWVTLELKKALELGYKVVKVHEVWHFCEVEQYDPLTKTGGLFAEYINTFLQLKQEADGVPASAADEQAVTAFISEWEKREGIHLRRDNLVKNSGMRALAKLMLNSFWGKFGQRSTLTKTMYFTAPVNFFSLVFDPMMDIHNVTIINDGMVSITYSHVDEFVEVNSNTNVVIAAYTTAQARLKLYEYIEQLQDRVLYFDTDSVIYVEGANDSNQPKIGAFLGDMTDELKDYGAGSFITEFVSAGPKHYGIQIFSTKDDREITVVKVKGFRLDHHTSAAINFDALVEKVKHFVSSGGDQEETEIVLQRIERRADRTKYARLEEVKLNGANSLRLRNC